MHLLEKPAAGRRGAIEYDFVIATVLFLTVYAMLFASMPHISVNFRSLEDPAHTAAVYLSEKAVASPGYPKAWTSIASASELGFAYYNGQLFANVLDANKVGQLPAYSCASLASKTPLSNKLSFKIRVENASVGFECTASVPQNARVVERPAYLKNNSLFLPYKVKVWTW